MEVPERLGARERVAQTGGDFPMIFRKSRTDHWELKVPDFRTLIAAKNASFSGYFKRSCIWVEMDPKNEASLAAIRGQNVGIPDWRLVGRNFPRIFRKSWTNRWGLKVPDFRTLITDKNAPFFGDFRRPGTGVEMDPQNEASLAAIRVRKSGTFNSQ